MKRLLCTVLGLICLGRSAAQEKGRWRAASKTAMSITGDVALADEKISINYVNFTIAPIRSLRSAEIGAAFDADPAAGGSGSLYRLSVPASKKFVRNNTLCGAEETQWLATYVVGKSLQMAFFSGASMPVFTPEALTVTTNLCGTYAYVR